jgi:hypothetical protein
MNTEYDKQLSILINEAIECIDNFYEDFKDDKKLNDYFLLLDRIFSLLDNENIKFEIENFQKIKHHYGNNEDKNDSEEERIKWRRKSFTRFLLKNSLIWKEKINEDDMVWERMDAYIVEGTMREYSEKIPMYYKNFMPIEIHSKFEEMVDLVRYELISYHTKLIYCKKIIDFLNEEFAQDGVILTQTNFLHQYLNTAASEMILVSTKLFATAKINANFGFDYLKDYIAKNCNNNPELRGILGGELRGLISKGKKKCKELVIVRNSLIAHYDIEKVTEAKNIRVSYEELNELYEISVEILQMLSFYRFERLSCIFPELIKAQTFKVAVCQNPWSNSLNLDIDNYFAVLRKNFLPNLIKAAEEINKKK